jgi:multisubunit Na+/H+ antiporter MnhC subunit
MGGLIAVIFICVIGVLLILALFRFKTVEDVLKLWGGLGSIATAIATFYFTTGNAEKRVQAAQQDKQRAEQTLSQTQRELTQAQQALTQMSKNVTDLSDMAVNENPEDKHTARP